MPLLKEPNKYTENASVYLAALEVKGLTLEARLTPLSKSGLF